MLTYYFSRLMHLLFLMSVITFVYIMFGYYVQGAALPFLGTVGTTTNSHLPSDGYAPFSSMTGRESCIYPTDNVIAAPGPGQYDPREPQNVVKVGFIFWFRHIICTLAELPGFARDSCSIIISINAFYFYKKLYIFSAVHIQTYDPLKG